MPELTFQVRGAGVLRAAAAPAIALRLEVSNFPPSETIQNVLLNCQIQMEVARRRYAAAEQSRLRDLFGEPERWGETLRPFLWTNLTTTVPAFTGSIGIQLVVQCPSDFSLTATKYFHGVEEGAVPLKLLFSGTVFYRTDANQLQTAPIPWSTEARFAMPAGIWKECIDLHHPNTRWLALRRDVFERLYEFKVQQGLATFDEAVERMIENALEVDA
jgi:Family of unknown function (DUF6084)